MNASDERAAIRQGGEAFRRWVASIFAPLVGNPSTDILSIKIIPQLGISAGYPMLVTRSHPGEDDDQNFRQRIAIIEGALTAFGPEDTLDALNQDISTGLAAAADNRHRPLCEMIRMSDGLGIGVAVLTTSERDVDAIALLFRTMIRLLAASLNAEKMSLGVETLSKPFWQAEETEKAAAVYTVDAIREATKCVCAIIWLTEPDSAYLKLVAANGNAPPGIELTMRIGEGAVGKCQECATPFIVNDLQSSKDLAEFGITAVAHPNIIRNLNWRSAIFVPLDAGGQSLGVVAAYGQRVKSFSINERDVVIAFAQRFTAALVHARRHAELDRLNDRLTKHAPAIEAGLMAIRHVHDIHNLLFQVQNKLNEITTRTAHQNSSIVYQRALEASTFLDRSSRMLGRMVRTAAAPGNLVPAKRDLKVFLHDLIEPFQSSESKRGISINLNCADGIELRLDPHQIGQAITNIIENAVTFLAADNKSVKKAVTVRASDKSETVEIEILDNGPGFQPGHEKDIFNPFYTTRPGKGLGFGLWIAQNALKAHGGKIIASSEWGFWSRFTLQLPKYGTKK